MRTMPYETYPDETYILTIYKIVVVHTCAVHFISLFKKNSETTSNSDSYNILKCQEKCCIKSLVELRAQQIYNNIIRDGGWSSCHIIEICRCICTSLKTAQTIADKQIKNSCKPNDTDKKYECQPCNYSTNLECHWIRHQTGKKHMEKLQINEMIDNTNTLHMCNLCENTYKSRTSLWKHKKNCSLIHNVDISHRFINIDNPYNQNDHTTIAELVMQNEVLIAGIKELAAEVKEQNAKIAELSKQPTTIIHNNNNNHNNFNLNFFLNETCKGAMTITQFIESLQINLDTVEYTGKNGYVAGISKIFMDGLRQLEVNMRPIHCTDLKRETLYIKDTDGWEKDNPEKSKFDKALDTVARRNAQQVREWVHHNPRCDIIDSREYQQHLSIMEQCLGGGMDKEEANNRKIRKMVAREVLIKKKMETI